MVRKSSAQQNEMIAQQALLDCCNEATLILNRAGDVLAANLAAGVWLDRPTPELTGKNAETLFGEDENFSSMLEGLPDLAVGQRLTGALKPNFEESAVALVTVSRLPDAAHSFREDLFLICARPDTQQEQLLADTLAVSQRVDDLHLTLAEVKRQLVERTLQLAEQRNMMKVILRGIGDGLVVFNDKGHVIEYNSEAIRVLGLENQDPQGLSFAEVCPPLNTALGGWDGVVYGLLKAREDLFTLGSFDLRANTAPLRREGDIFLGCVVILIDRTKEAEVDRLKSDLISIVSHELRSPLTSIKGYIDLLAAGELGEINSEQKGYLDIVLNNTKRLTSLIDDMLDLSRIESGKLQMAFGKVDVRYLVDFCALTLKPLATQKQQVLQSKFAEYDLNVAGDVERLQQALMNLAGNAIKYTPENGAIEIGVTRQNGEIRISVHDNGIGISPDDQKRLFEKFYRVKNKATRGISGTGLGLCITKSIIEAHGGRIEIESQEGNGSTFTVVLPTYENSPLH